MSATRPSPAIRQVRSTMVLSSRSALTAAGLLPTYEAFLAPATRDYLTTIVAGTWLPIGLVMEHYAACDSLALSPNAQRALGRSNGERLRGTLLGTLGKIAMTAGTTPGTLIEQMPRFWSRIFDGGSFTPERRGPKDVGFRVVASPLLRSEYFRNGLAGTAESMLCLVSIRFFIRMERTEAEPDAVTYLAQWV